MRSVDRRSFLKAAGGASVLASSLAAPAIAQAAFPNRPLRLIVPAPAGSRHGVSARIFADEFGKALGQPVEVVNPDNTPPTNYALIAGAAADGYTLGYGTVELAIMHWRGLTGLKPTDVTALALINEDPAGIHVKADSPWQTIRQLTDHIRANPGQLKASSTPAGGIWHLSTVGWLGASGLKHESLPWLPATGPAAAVEDMMLGGADVIVCSTPEVRATPQAKATRTLAVMARDRIPRFGNVPTLQQASGTSHVSGAWRGLVGPRGLDSATAATLTTAAKAAWDSKGFQSTMRRRGFQPAWADGRGFAQYMEASSTRLGKALRDAGVIKA
jgi:tripartite-type tricarboxylate transporter receptor subunit TctC